MPEFLPGSVSTGLFTVLLTIILRARSEKPRLSVPKLALAGILSAFVIPHAVALFSDKWHAIAILPDLPVITSGQVFIGGLTIIAVLSLSHMPGQAPSIPVWAGLLSGVAVALILPPLLDWSTGRFQRLSLRADVNHCTRGMAGELQPTEVTNICDELIVVGLCVPGEVNPKPCSQSYRLRPGEIARFDPGEMRLSSLPSNANGLTIVACSPPARPSRMGRTTGRGYEGVCLPPD